MAPEGGRWLRAGLVGRPHGLDGSFYVREPTPALPEQGAQVVLGEEERTIVRRAGDERRPIIRLGGCEDREAAEALRGEPLMVPRTEAPELEEDEWWEEDLVGCVVRDGERVLGSVRRLLGLPSVDVLEVVRTDGEPDLLVPLVSDAVRSVDVEQKLIDIDLRFLGGE
ncbi:MAG TPA: ribosome maturation factor RimM [Solirubrobacteraceae bacterium]|nr:ribosome maturation factor RimM [Solirubrobacteraceae bacterium]